MATVIQVTIMKLVHGMAVIAVAQHVLIQHMNVVLTLHHGQHVIQSA